MQKIDMGIFKPAKLCTCDNCGKQFIADPPFQPLWVDDIQKSWCECCAQWTYKCSKCEKVCSLENTFHKSGGCYICDGCFSKSDTAKPADADDAEPFFPLNYGTCGKCGKIVDIDRESITWIEDVEQAWCEKCAQWTYECAKCGKMFSDDRPNKEEGPFPYRSLCDKCYDNPCTGKRRIYKRLPKPVRKTEASKHLKPQNLSEAFSRKYRVWTINPKEKKALLTECQMLGLKWISGHAPLEFDPGQEEFYLEAYDGLISYGIEHTKDWEIRWADLPEESIPSDKRDAVNVPLDWEKVLRNILRFKLLLNYDVNTDTYHKKAVVNREFYVDDIIPQVTHGANTLRQIIQHTAWVVKGEMLHFKLNYMENVYDDAVKLMEAQGITFCAELEECVDQFMTDHMECDFDHDSILDKEFTDRKQVGKS